MTHEDLKSVTAQGQVPDLTVADITRRDVVTVCPQDPLSKALMVMSGRELGRVPVVDPQDCTRLVGLLRREDIVRAYHRAIMRKVDSKHQRESISLAHLTHTEVLQLPLSPDMAAVGLRIRDLHLPASTLIIGIRRAGEVLIPHGDTQLQPGDTVVALAQPEAVDYLRNELVKGAQSKAGRQEAAVPGQPAA